MSASASGADIRATLQHVCFVPIPEVANSFDDFLCGREQRGRHCEAESLRGPEIDYHLEFGGLHDRQVCWLFSCQYSARVCADLLADIHDVRPVANQPTGGGK